MKTRIDWRYLDVPLAAAVLCFCLFLSTLRGCHTDPAVTLADDLPYDGIRIMGGDDALVITSEPNVAPDTIKIDPNDSDSAWFRTCLENPICIIGPNDVSMEITFDANGLHVHDPHQAMDEAAEIFFQYVLKGQVDAYMEKRAGDFLTDGRIRQLAASGRFCRTLGHRWGWQEDGDYVRHACSLCGDLSAGRQDQPELDMERQ